MVFLASLGPSAVTGPAHVASCALCQVACTKRHGVKDSVRRSGTPRGVLQMHLFRFLHLGLSSNLRLDSCSLTYK